MKTIKRLGYTLIHPFAGFNDCIETKRFPLAQVWIILALLFLGSVLQQQYSGFLFNFHDPNELNILFVFGRTVMLFLLWCAANWAITTLFEGKGTLRQIMYASAVAIIPYVISLYLYTLLSNVMLQEEQAFLTIIQWAGILFSVFVMMAALMTIHDYTLRQVTLSALASVAFILIVLFLAVIIFSLFQQAYGFFKDVFNELALLL